MKNNRTTLAVVALLSILVASCNTSNKKTLPKDNQVTFDTLIVQNKQYLHNDTANPFCELSVHFVYPITSAKTDLVRLKQLFIRNTLGQTYDAFTPQEAVERYTKTFLRNYEADARIFQDELQDLESHPNLIPQNLDIHHEDEMQTNDFYSYQETLTNKIHFNESDILSFQVHRSNIKGGSAAYSAYTNYVINLQTGKLITESDLFTPGYDIALQQIFAANLMKQNGVNTISDLEELGYFGIDEIMPNRNFLIDANGITYVFNKGEYSAYLLDAPEISFSFDEVRMLLKQNTVLTKLVQQ